MRTVLWPIIQYAAAIIVAFLLVFLLLLVIQDFGGTKDSFDIATEYATALAASILGIFFVLMLDRNTRAQLHATAVTHETDNEQIQPDGTKRKFLHANIVNPPLWRLHSFFQDRKTAHGTTAELQFFDYDGEKVSRQACPLMKGKWRDNKVPDFDKYYKDLKQLPHGYDDTRDIPSGENLRNHLDIVMKIDSDPNCYGYNLEAELYPDNNNRGPYELPPGKYVVRITLTTAGRSFDDYLLLCNGPNYSDCTILNIYTRKDEIKTQIAAVLRQQTNGAAA